MGEMSVSGLSQLDSPRSGLCAYFCIGQYLRRYNFVWPKSLPWVDERREDLVTISRLETSNGKRVVGELALPAFLHSLPREVGKGLLIPKGMVTSKSENEW